MASPNDNIVTPLPVIAIIGAFLIGAWVALGFKEGKVQGFARLITVAAVLSLTFGAFAALAPTFQAQADIQAAHDARCDAYIKNEWNPCVTGLRPYYPSEDKDMELRDFTVGNESCYSEWVQVPECYPMNASDAEIFVYRQDAKLRKPPASDNGIGIGLLAFGVGFMLGGK
jgi:hypothetical protein